MEDAYRVALYQAELARLRRLVGAMRDGTVGGVQGWRDNHKGQK